MCIKYIENSKKKEGKSLYVYIYIKFIIHEKDKKFRKWKLCVFCECFY